LYVLLFLMRDTHLAHYILLDLTYLLNPFSYTLRRRGCSPSPLLIILQTVGLLGGVISSSQGLYLNTGQHKHRINTYTYQTSMPCEGLEPTIPASERANTAHAPDRSATATGLLDLITIKILGPNYNLLLLELKLRV
jgi:hypothetical protein